MSNKGPYGSYKLHTTIYSDIHTTQICRQCTILEVPKNER